MYREIITGMVEGLEIGSSNEVGIMGSVMGLFPLHNGVYLVTAIK